MEKQLSLLGMNELNPYEEEKLRKERKEKLLKELNVIIVNEEKKKKEIRSDQIKKGNWIKTDSGELREVSVISQYYVKVREFNEYSCNWYLRRIDIENILAVADSKYDLLQKRDFLFIDYVDEKYIGWCSIREIIHDKRRNKRIFLVDTEPPTLVENMICIRNIKTRLEFIKEKV